MYEDLNAKRWESLGANLDVGYYNLIEMYYRLKELIIVRLLVHCLAYGRYIAYISFYSDVIFQGYPLKLYTIIFTVCSYNSNKEQHSYRSKKSNTVTLSKLLYGICSC